MGAEPVIIVDDNEEDQGGSQVETQTQAKTKSTLSQEQRDRITQQKKLALARRLAIQCRRANPALVHGATNEDSLNAFRSFRKRPFAAPIKVVNLDEDDVQELETPGEKHAANGRVSEMLLKGQVMLDNEGWRSVRKRTLPGLVFGEKGFHNSPKSVEDALHCGCKQSPGPEHISLDDVGTQLRSKLLQCEPVFQKNMTLSRQQKEVLMAIQAGKSAFLTGSAGTGKSFLLQKAVHILQNMHGDNSVFVTASTGLAACAIGGTTLHSFAGIGLGLADKKELAITAQKKRDVRKRWLQCKALIIDEISMIDGELFDKLEYVASVVRQSLCKGKAFGGIQLVVTGDFFQLPPVQPENPDKYFAFQSECWDKCFDFQVELTHVFRQSDCEFVDMLNELRKGACTSVTESRLKACNRPATITSTRILMTKLYPRKMDVARENEQNLRALNKDTIPFVAKDEGKSDFALRQLENVRAEKVLHLCVGAQVMLVKNVDAGAGLVNGARGVVVKFVSVDNLDAADTKDLAKKLSPTGFWPVVLFACDGLERVVKPESWSIMEGNTEVAKRSQVPLILAWALSLHKCQGMTLDRVEIDLSRSFEYGMVYVALSRVKSLDGLRLIGFDASLIKVHPKVVLFYEQLQAVDSICL